MTTFDDQMEQTPAGIPVSLRPFFQEYVLEDLDPERSAFTVIERTLAWGEVPELRWPFARYGPGRLAERLRQAGWRCLPRRWLKYWLCFFEMTDYTGAGAACIACATTFSDFGFASSIPIALSWNGVGLR